MKKLTSIILTLSLAASLTACSKNQGASSTITTPTPNSKPALTQSLSVGILPDVDSIPLIIAREQKYFEEEKLDIKLESFKSAMERDSALQAKKIDGAVSDILAATFAKEGGFAVKITSKTDGTYKLLAGKDSGINSIKDLKGKSLALSKNTIIEYTTDMMLKEGGLKSEDINKTVVAQIPARLEMLQNGKIDTATLPDPLASVAIKNGAKLINSSDKMGINPGILLYTEDAIKNKTNEIKAFYRAYNRAIEYLESHKKEEYIDLLISKASFPEDVKTTLTLPKYTKATLPTEKDFKDVVEWQKSKELIKNNYNYNDLVDGSLIKE